MTKKNSAKDFLGSLNDALMCKNSNSFWKSWRPKFCGKQTAQVTDRYCDEKDTADRFAGIFQAAYVLNSERRHKDAKRRQPAK